MKLMMKRFLFPAWLLLCIFLAGCEEEIDIDSVKYISDAMVFEGVVTNEAPPYFFRLTKVVGLTEDNGNYYDGIDNAVVVITDITEGIRDTLALVPHRMGPGGVFLDYYDYARECNDSTVINRMFQFHCDGVYATTKIYGIEGHSYSLDIYREGKHYLSDVQKMEPALHITDMTYKLVDLGEKGLKPAPCISFTNPPGENYYLFYHYPYSYVACDGISNPSRFFGASHQWLYSIVKDEYMEENVKDFIVDDGENAFGYAPGWNYFPGDSLYVWAQTISRSCYDVYHQMIEQLRTDGGAYTPVPTNIKSNISGGVHGCFRVSAVSEKGVAVERL